MNSQNELTNTHTHTRDNVDKAWVVFSLSSHNMHGWRDIWLQHLSKQLKIQAHSAHIFLCQNTKEKVAADFEVSADSGFHMKNNTHVML